MVKNFIENSKILYIVKKIVKKLYTLYKNKFLKKFHGNEKKYWRDKKIEKIEKFKKIKINQ